MFNKLKPLLYIALAGVSLSLLSFFVWLSNDKKNDNIYFGNPTNISTSTFLISDKFNGEIFVYFSSSTKFFQGGDEIKYNDNLLNGKFIQVTGNKKEDKEINAEIIRIMKAPKENVK